MDNAEQEARELVAAQVDEARQLVNRYCLGGVPTYRQIAAIIAHVRQQAERAALEKAANVCERYAGDSRQIIEAVRALMQPEQKGKG